MGLLLEMNFGRVEGSQYMALWPAINKQHHLRQCLINGEFRLNPIYKQAEVHHQVSKPTTIKMNSFILIITLLVSTEIQFNLCNGHPSSPQEAENKQEEVQAAKLAYETLKTNIEKRLSQASDEYNETLRKLNDELEGSEALADVVSAKPRIKSIEDEKIAEDEYNQALLAANEKLSKAKEEYIAVCKTAYEKFEKARDQFEENRQKIESEHHEELAKGRQDKDTALKLAEERLNKARKEYSNAMRSKGSMSYNKKERIKNKLDDEERIYEKAVELANDEWEKVLDATGINKQYEADLGKAAKELQQILKKAEVNLKKAKAEYGKALKDPIRKIRKAKRQVPTERWNDEGKQIWKGAYSKFDKKVSKAWNEWFKIKDPADEELENAYAKYVAVENEANKDIQKVQENSKPNERQLEEKEEDDEEDDDDK
ncbi:hypothetical protein V9T40_012107 [Parthenolecanium corni]|uniref:Uncharacterized protein n=1 Tax=Parthenolecanium corni TaxID=536013 RepID=A0AAN9XYS6_9HEMI